LKSKRGGGAKRGGTMSTVVWRGPARKGGGSNQKWGPVSGGKKKRGSHVQKKCFKGKKEIHGDRLALKDLSVGGCWQETKTNVGKWGGR